MNLRHGIGQFFFTHSSINSSLLFESDMLEIIGIIGILGMTWLFPILGRMVFYLLRPIKVHGASAPNTSGKKIRILIPAHNEEETLQLTLDRILQAKERVLSQNPSHQISIQVGLDGCTDQTKEIALKNNVEVLETSSNQGKWKTLHQLVETNQDADWIIFADAGILWNDDFLIRAVSLMQDPEVMAIAPTYQNPKGGAIEQLFWQVERHFKAIETLAGGPISIHGASICYRRRELTQAIRGIAYKTQTQNHLNDDVVLPLYMRTIFPRLKIVYNTQIQIQDQKPHQDRELSRRKRMVIGNIQWIREFLGFSLKRNFVVSLLALRRVFRTLWAYWFSFIAMSVLIYFPGLSLLGSGLFLIGFLFSQKLRNLSVKTFDCALASFMAPFLLLSKSHLEGTTWK